MRNGPCFISCYMNFGPSRVCPSREGSEQYRPARFAQTNKKTHKRRTEPTPRRAPSETAPHRFGWLTLTILPPLRVRLLPLAPRVGSHLEQFLNLLLINLEYLNICRLLSRNSRRTLDGSETSSLMAMGTLRSGSLRRLPSVSGRAWSCCLDCLFGPLLSVGGVGGWGRCGLVAGRRRRRCSW